METENKASTIAGTGCLILFFIPFILVGLGTLGYSGYLLYQVQQAKNWVASEAQLIETGIESHSSSGSSSTRKVLIQYEYSYNNQIYIGEQLSFDTGTDNVELHYQIRDKLNTALAIEVYVNPTIPSQAVVLRGITNSMVFIFLFAAFWNGVLTLFFFPFLGVIKNPETMKKIALFIGVVFFTMFYFSFFGKINTPSQIKIIAPKEIIDNNDANWSG